MCSSGLLMEKNDENAVWKRGLRAMFNVDDQHKVITRRMEDFRKLKRETKRVSWDEIFYLFF